MKCKYCEKEAYWYNYYTKSYYCKEHAVEKVKQLQGDCKDEFGDTPKDWFRLASYQENLEKKKD